MSPRAGLDRDAVVAAAVDLVNREGAGALSLKRLADELGVQTPSLYNHVDGLPGLQRELTLLNARLLGDALTAAAIGKAGPAAIAALMDAYREYIKANPGLYLYAVRPAALDAPHDAERTRAETRIVMVAVAVVNSFGLTGDDAIHAVRALRSVVHGFATLESAGGFGIPLDLDESFRRLVAMVIAGLERQQLAAGTGRATASA
ncbi:MAG: WHG domain-containing protein [Caldilinea sp.]|nr:WHG domain-containing protein [Caldilineaceae bacterium]MCB9122206.1 WHG domain-containing protein [Caldilineaceae bacterium]MCO5210666.1 WHG domain-containing protein [Caldilinea sp.]